MLNVEMLGGLSGFLGNCIWNCHNFLVYSSEAKFVNACSGLWIYKKLNFDFLEACGYNVR